MTEERAEKDCNCPSFELKEEDESNTNDAIEPVPYEVEKREDHIPETFQ